MKYLEDTSCSQIMTSIRAKKQKRVTPQGEGLPATNFGKISLLSYLRKLIWIDSIHYHEFNLKSKISLDDMDSTEAMKSEDFSSFRLPKTII